MERRTRSREMEKGRSSRSRQEREQTASHVPPSLPGTDHLRLESNIGQRGMIDPLALMKDEHKEQDGSFQRHSRRLTPPTPPPPLLLLLLNYSSHVALPRPARDSPTDPCPLGCDVLNPPSFHPSLPFLQSSSVVEISGRAVECSGRDQFKSIQAVCGIKKRKEKEKEKEKEDGARES